MIATTLACGGTNDGLPDSGLTVSGDADAGQSVDAGNGLPDSGHLGGRDAGHDSEDAGQVTLDAGHDDEDAGHVGVDSGTGVTDGGRQPVSFQSQVLPIILSNCTGYCHAGTNTPMSLESPVAFQNLVSAPSVGCADRRPLVKPGAAGTRNSYLMAKLVGHDVCSGGRMPPTGALAAQDIATIRAWIEDGAPNN